MQWTRRPFLWCVVIAATILSVFLLYQAARANSASANNASPVPVIKPQPVALPAFPEKTFTAKSGDTLDGILARAGIGVSERLEAIDALRSYFSPSAIRTDQKIQVEYTAGGRLRTLKVYTTKRQFFAVKRQEDGLFRASEEEVSVTSRLVAEKVQITNTLFGAASRKDLPFPIIQQMVKLLSYDVDFQRDISKGDSFAILYEKNYAGNSAYVDSGDIIYLSLSMRNKKIEMYRFVMPDGTTSYFNPKGESIEKSLLMTPIDTYRVSSGYGMRKHPILGYTRMHKGIDFAASEGTPIYSAGNGVVEKVGQNGGYGRYIRIDHGMGYQTAYAHMSRYARGIYKGMQVKQGDVIGYVGMTGRATGPHLHYEILVNGEQINPLAIKSPPRRQITGLTRAIYRYYKKQIHALMGSVLQPG